MIPTKQQQKRAKKQKKKNKEQPTPSLPIESPTITSIPFSLDDENAFPTLGQEVSIPVPKKSDTNKETGKPKTISFSSLFFHLLVR